MVNQKLPKKLQLSVQWRGIVNVQFGHELLSPSPLVYRWLVQPLHINCNQLQPEAVVSCKQQVEQEEMKNYDAEHQAEQQQATAWQQQQDSKGADLARLRKEAWKLQELQKAWHRKQQQQQLLPQPLEPPELPPTCSRDVASFWGVLMLVLHVLYNSSVRQHQHLLPLLLLRKVDPADEEQRELMLNGLKAVWAKDRNALYDLGHEQQGKVRDMPQVKEYEKFLEKQNKHQKQPRQQQPQEPCRSSSRIVRHRVG